MQPYLQACRAAAVSTLPLPAAHALHVELAERLLPRRIHPEHPSANAQ
jgi:hypothetical protein